MKQWIKNNIDKILALLAVFILVILVAPVLYISQYAYPWADDFTYSWTVRATYLSTHNVLKAVMQALYCMNDVYMSWQGTFSSCFLMSLQPAVFGIRCYHITAYMMVGSVLVAYYVMSYTICRVVLKAPKSYSVILWVITSLVSIENVKGQAEAFTWYNSAVHYTFNNSMFILFLSLIIIAEKKNKKLLKILTLILGFLVAGGNNVTVFGGLLFMISAEVFMLFLHITESGKEQSAENEKPLSYISEFRRLLPYTIVFCIGAVINFLAPGNSSRLEVVGGAKESISGTILLSFRMGAQNCVTWFNGTILLFLVVAFILFRHIFNLNNNTYKNSFRYPALVLLMSFCLFSALNAPIVYTSGPCHLLRTDNMMVFSYILLLMIDVFYFCGWLCSKGYKFMNCRIRYEVIAVCGAFIIMIIWCRQLAAINPTYFLTDSAVYSINNKCASFYGYIMKENTTRLKEPEKNVKVMRFVVDPSILYPHDAEDWKSGTRLFYDKDSVEYEE